jgi:hypothetical protein
MPSGVGRAAREDAGRIQRPGDGGVGGPEPRLVGRRSPIGWGEACCRSLPRDVSWWS